MHCAGKMERGRHVHFFSTSVRAKLGTKLGTKLGQRSAFGSMSRKPYVGACAISGCAQLCKSCGAKTYTHVLYLQLGIFRACWSWCTSMGRCRSAASHCNIQYLRHQNIESSEVPAAPVGSHTKHGTVLPHDPNCRS